MDLREGLAVIYNDLNGKDRAASIETIVNISGIVNLSVFVTLAEGYRLDKTNIPYSVTASPTTWRNA